MVNLKNSEVPLFLCLRLYLSEDGGSLTVIIDRACFEAAPGSPGSSIVGFPEMSVSRYRFIHENCLTAFCIASLSPNKITSIVFCGSFNGL